MKLEGAIIAAGRGERLRRSGGTQLPKPLVELNGETLLVRQARALLAAGAESVVAVINSETASLVRNFALPGELRLVVRDTSNSMESLLVLGESLRGSHFLLATVDAILPQPQLSRFVPEGYELVASPNGSRKFDGVLAVTRWSGDKRPLFADVTNAGLIAALGDRQTDLVTAGVYLLPRSIFEFAAKARERNLGALRQFLSLLIAEHIRLGAVEVHGAIDLDEAADLEAARRLEEQPEEDDR